MLKVSVDVDQMRVQSKNKHINKVDQCSKVVNYLSVFVPRIVDEIIHSLRVKNLKFIAFAEELKEAWHLVSSKHWKGVHCISDFVESLAFQILR